MGRWNPADIILDFTRIKTPIFLFDFVLIALTHLFDRFYFIREREWTFERRDGWKYKNNREISSKLSAARKAAYISGLSKILHRLRLLLSASKILYRKKVFFS